MHRWLPPISMQLAAALDGRHAQWRADNVTTEENNPTLRLVPAESTQDDEHDWIERAQAGDRQAQRRLFDRYAVMVFDMARRMVWDRLDAQEVAQEALAAAFAGLPRLREPQAFVGWLRRIVIFKARSFLRRRAIWRRFGLERAAPDENCWISPELSPSERSEVAEVLSRLKCLSIDERLVWTLRHVEELTLPELAAHLRLSLTTTKRRLARAEARLAKLRG